MTDSRSCVPAGSSEDERDAFIESSTNVGDLLWLTKNSTAHTLILFEGCGSGGLAFDLYRAGLTPTAHEWGAVSVQESIDKPMFAFVGTGQGSPAATSDSALPALQGLTWGVRGCERFELTQGYDLVDALRSRFLGGSGWVSRLAPESLEDNVTWSEGDLALITPFNCAPPSSEED